MRSDWLPDGGQVRLHTGITNSLDTLDLDEMVVDQREVAIGAARYHVVRRIVAPWLRKTTG